MIGFGTGKGFLVYQLHWIMDLVQEKAVWCTNCIESWVLYRERLSVVPTALNRGFGTGKGRLYQRLESWILYRKGRLYQRLESWILYRKRPSVPTPWIVDFVQEKAVCTNALNRGFWAVETFLEYKTLWLENLVYDWVCGHWDCWSDWWKCKVSLQWVLNFFTFLEKWLIAKILTNN